MVTVYLLAETKCDPSTGWWRVFALDLQRQHTYVTTQPVLQKALDNIIALVREQYAPEDVNVTGMIGAI